MKYVDIVINLPARPLNKSYTYSVPVLLEAEATFGKRVLVDFAGRLEEGFIVREREGEPGPFKPIKKVLDQEEVFDRQLLDLAYWMADYYLCPLSLVLNLIVPRILQQQKAEIVLPALDQEKLSTIKTPIRPFLELLLDKGELPMREALKNITKEELKDLEERGLVKTIGVYRVGRETGTDYIYLLGQNYEPALLPTLKKRAPRQAEALELLIASGQLPRKQLQQVIPSSAIKALLKKGYIELEKKPHPLIAAPFSLSEKQELAVQRVGAALQTKKTRELLIFGVTGSGKTEVYVKTAELAIAMGRGVIVLVPEIALTRQLVKVFGKRIENIAVLHSQMTSGERYNEWKRIKRGEAQLVLGARSAVFAPVRNLGLIIIDEEQESTFKQEELPRYHALEIARKRCQQTSSVLVLGSATPSVESFYKATQTENAIITLNQRVGGGKVPEVTIVDLRKSATTAGNHMISPFLQEKIEQRLRDREQTILLINRRGYSPMTICRECGTIFSCPFCSVGMNYHQEIKRHVCHYCNYQVPAQQKCGKCGSCYLQLLGAGTQKIEEEIKRLFPQARVQRLDLDSSRRKGAQQSILDGMKQGKVDILIGTQMVAKGLDFSKVSLVGIIDADSLLNLPDFRAGEKGFQMLVQAAGRAGRSSSGGEVIIQTYQPDHPIIEMAAAQDYQSFYRQEIKNRKLLAYPPFTQLLRVVLSSVSEEGTRQAAQEAAEMIEELIDAREEEIVVLGPAPCPIYKLRRRYRYQLMVKCEHLDLLQSIGEYILAKVRSPNIKMDLDLNPVLTM